ncbi:hypothetical protein ACWF94_00705 [Streptomyces sp. NPDC055078]
MTQSVRWLLVIVGALTVFGLCVVLGELVLPWDRPERIATGAGAGAVIAGLLGAWAATSFARAEPPEPAPEPAAGQGGTAGQGVTASGERSVATGDNSGVIITGDGGTVQR